MATFIETIFQMASVDHVIVDFANFCCLLHARLGFVDQGCNFDQISKKLINYLKENSSLENRKKKLWNIVLMIGTSSSLYFFFMQVKTFALS